MEKPRIAVIAVHGVGDHKPGQTSTAIAEQLQHFAPGQFGTFECTPLQLAVDAGELQPPSADSAPSAGTSYILPEGVAALGRGAMSDQVKGKGSDIAFTAITLTDGAGYVDSYSTTRLRLGTEGNKSVDLYEMFWSDLSHGGTSGTLSSLRQMLQLFLHVATLGRTALSTMLAKDAQHGPNSLLSFVYGLSAWGYWLLAVPIALGNLLMLCLGASLLAFVVPNSETGRIGTVIAAAIMVIGLAGARFQKLIRKEDVPRLVLRYGLGFILCVTPVLSLWVILNWSDQWPQARTVALALALGVSVLLGSMLVDRYAISRPGARICWQVLLAAGVVWGLIASFLMRGVPRTNPDLDWFALLIQANFIVLVIACAALACVNLLLFFVGGYARFRCSEDVRRSVDTSLIAAAVPAPLLLAMVLTLWSVFWHALKDKYPELMGTQIYTMSGKLGPTVSKRMSDLIDLSASPAAAPFAFCMIVALALAVVALFPSVIAELTPSRKPGDLASSRGLWRWLEQGFGLLGRAKWIAVIAFFFLMPLGLAMAYSGRTIDLSRIGIHNRDILSLSLPNLSVFVGGSAFGFLALTKLLGATSLKSISRAAARVRVVVDTAIDVDNWLRERPVGWTPRLRIMARYVSLLRHLRDQHYDSIVVVSHSQGTVVTLDLLRYLNALNSTFLHQLPQIDLLTFGSPLRQLYAKRFPGLYFWAEHADYREAGLANWYNGYGSGDYVGRNLWPSNGVEPWQPGPVNQQEYCMGALAHTHYFDEHAPAVALAIINAIRQRPGFGGRIDDAA